MGEEHGIAADHGLVAGLGSVLVRKARADGSTKIGDALIRPALKRLVGWEGSLIRSRVEGEVERFQFRM